MTARRVLIAGSFVLAAAVGAVLGTLWSLGRLMDGVEKERGS